ncbi:MAG: hypothetical protein MRECE_2c010 [Mycoplasmataceae bacterium CE_OT135]|nr:MAG: hypothetical protein MRECE_2c010 [Mycoplasmataceae bacterium CE_OT135]
MNQPLTAEQANQELITQVLTQILAEKPSLLPTSPTCQCHWIDPNKLRILLWKDNKETYILKIAEQKFVGVARSDRRGEVYWKFRELYEGQEAKPTDAQPQKSSETQSPSLPPEIEANKPLSMYSKAEVNRIIKFRERQAQAQPAPENNQKQEASN